MHTPFNTPRTWRRSLTLSLPLAALALAGCEPRPDFPIGSDVVVLGDAVDVFPARGRLEHASANWIVLRGDTGKMRYIRAEGVIQMTTD